MTELAKKNDYKFFRLQTIANQCVKYNLLMDVLFEEYYRKNFPHYYFLEYSLRLGDQELQTISKEFLVFI